MAFLGRINLISTGAILALMRSSAVVRHRPQVFMVVVAQLVLVIPAGRPFRGEN
jgi:hypothetical protein